MLAGIKFGKKEDKGAEVGDRNGGWKTTGEGKDKAPGPRRQWLQSIAPRKEKKKEKRKEQKSSLAQPFAT